MSETRKTILTQDNIMKILNECYEKSLNGVPVASSPIDTMVEDYMSKYNDPEIACKQMLKNQVAKCTTSGIVTGFGGVITLPITVPANISTVLYVQMRMVACTAAMAGLDIRSDMVQTLVYACLAGVSVNQVVKKTGIKFGTKLAEQGIKKIPGKTFAKVNNRLGFKFITKFGEKGIINLGKLLPGVGAAINGGFDYAETKIIANRAYKMFFEGDLSAGETLEDEIEEVA